MMTVLQLVNQLLDNMGQTRVTSVINAPVPGRQALAALNDIYAEILQTLPLHEFVKTDAVAVVANQSIYSLSNSVATGQLLAHTLRLNGALRPLRQLTIEQAAILPEGQSGMPHHYWLAEEQLHLWPVPDKAYSLTYSYTIAPQLLTTDEQTIALPGSWERVLVRGAQALLAQFLGESELASTHYGLYQDGLSQLRARIARGSRATMRSAYPPPQG